ncbi:MAG: hypothetical protein IPQ16_08335 [Geobacteraceae bacterium]|nr:hypothetical protein [Geobacteraceae bacterium]
MKTGVWTRITDWSRCFMVAAIMLLCGLFMCATDAHAIRLDIKFNTGTAIPGDINTNLPTGNNSNPGDANFKYVTLFSETPPAENSTTMQDTYATAGTWYPFANVYYRPDFATTAEIQANATGRLKVRTSRTTDSFDVELWHYSAAGTKVAQLGNTVTVNGATNNTNRDIAFSNAAYTLPAGDLLLMQVRFRPNNNGDYGRILCNTGDESYINVGIKFNIVSSAGAGGTISGPATTPGTAAVDYKSDQTYVATANAGQSILTFTVDGVSVPAAVGQTSFTYTGPAVTGVRSNHTIDVQFQAASGSFNVAPGTGGCITVQGYGACPGTTLGPPPWAGGTTYSYPTVTGTYIFDVVPDAGYGIEQVLINGVDQGVPLGQTTLWSTAPLTLTTGATVNLTASFLPYINVTSSAGTGGTISPAGTTAVLRGQAVTFDVVPDNGYRILSITDNGVDQGNTSPYTITNVTGPHDVVVTFKRVYYITAIAGPNGTISPIGDVAVDAGTSRNFSFSPDSGFRVNDVLIDGTSVGAVSTYTFTNIAADHSIEVIFIDAPVPSTYCAVPAFITTPAPPNVMLMLSVESPMEGAANPSVTCTGTPSAINYTCNSSGLGTYDNSRNYYGYFENYKCYTYSGSGASGLFTPSGVATNHQCGGTGWSGNMLNWSTMLAVDAFRKAFTGGNRVVDSTTETVLLGAVNDGNWFPANPTITNAEQYMPGLTGTGNTRTIMRRGAGVGFGVCNNGVNNCTVGRSGSGEAQWPTAGTNTANVYSLRIKACDSTGGVESRCNTTTNKPEGTIQKYMDKMRFSLISYAADNARERDGGVLREKMKWVGPLVGNGLKFHDASNTVVTCSTNAGCTNPEKEVNTDGTFVYNPDGASTGNSGLINYINKFAYASGYKNIDPISEMYYEVVRYFRNQTPSGSRYCDGLTEPNDNFPLYCNSSKTHARGWRDPSLYACSQNFVIAVNDANPHSDKRIPGTSFIAQAGSNEPGAGDWCGSARGSCDTDFTDGGVQVSVETWTKNVGDIEGLTGRNLGLGGCQVTAAGTCTSPMGTAYTVTNLGRVIQTGRDNSYLVAGLSYYAHMSDLRPDLAAKQNLTTYMIDTQEPQNNMVVGPRNMLYLAAKYGGFEDKDENGRPYLNASCGGVSASPNVLCSEWDADNDGSPDNYFFASDSAKVETSLYKAFSSILNRATSGTAAAVANNRSGERGANIIQALFYPQWPSDMGIKWLGDVQALWFYLDPIVKFSGIFEDSDHDRELNLAADRTPGTDATTVNALWKAGPELHARTASTRNIYTLLSATEMALTNTANSFEIANTAGLKPLMDISSLTDTDAQAVINYVRGVDSGTYRSRTVLNNGITRVWKLGDVINSTPQIQAGEPVNNYHLDYGDQEYKKYIQSTNYKARNFVYAGSNDGMLHAFRLGQVQRINDPDNVYRIASIIDETDLGKEEWAFIPKNARPYLKNCADSNYCHQYLVDGTPFLLDASINLYSGCTATNYWDCKRKTTYSGITTNLDTSQTSWRSIMIGSMGLGGANREGNCNETLSPDADATNNADCIKTPVAGSGYSSYFALDVTAPLAPVHMWEFSDGALPVADRGLGLTTPGPVAVRINSVSGTPLRADKTTNGRWFSVFASGPTGKIDAGTKQFLGRSDQNLKLYVVDIGTDANSSTPDWEFVRCTTAGEINCNYWVIDTGIKYAFANALINSSLDADKRDAYSDGYYSDDVVYITYTKAALDSSPSPGPYPTAWDKGGVIRLLTNNDPDPINWFTSKLIDDIGPVTRSVDIVQNRVSKKVWVYFGEGRYFFNGDDSATSRRIFGVADPCYNYDLDHINTYSTTAANCPAVTLGNLKDQSNTPNDGLSSTDKGWYITLDPASGANSAERLTGGVSANINGVVFFTTFIPSNDLCKAGGMPSQWAVNYNTGGVPPARAMSGKIIMTTSDQPIAKPINISGAFTQRGGRKLDASISNDLQGVPPPQPPPSVTLPPPVKRMMNIMER